MDMETIFTALAVILLIIGIALALFGKKIWDMVLAGIGGMIGWMLGFGIGILIFGTDSWTDLLIAVVLGFIGAFVVAAIFRYLVEAALALLAGILVGALVYLGTGEWIYALIACIVVGALAFFLMDRIVALVTAFIGAVLAGAAIWYLTDSVWFGVLGFIALFVLGSLLQQFVLIDDDD